MPSNIYDQYINLIIISCGEKKDPVNNYIMNGIF